MQYKVKAGILGLAIGDALGVPVEFKSRKYLEQNPISDMVGLGTHYQPIGTFSDDTSLTLCLLDSLSKGTIDYEDIMLNFSKWKIEGAYTAGGKLFDIGNTTALAIRRYHNGLSPLKSGLDTEQHNGNGSLMRVLPLVFYFTKVTKPLPEMLSIIENVSKLTHAHPRSIIACQIYVLAGLAIINGEQLNIALKQALNKTLNYYKLVGTDEELIHFKKLHSIIKYNNIPISSIKSSGYVIDTLEATTWCLLNSSSYKECVLKAVNLGDDTDTIAAVAGGLSGLVYGLEDIPVKWRNETLVNHAYIKALCDKFYNNFYINN